MDLPPTGISSPAKVALLVESPPAGPNRRRSGERTSPSSRPPRCRSRRRSGGRPTRRFLPQAEGHIPPVRAPALLEHACARRASSPRRCRSSSSPPGSCGPRPRHCRLRSSHIGVPLVEGQVLGDLPADCRAQDELVELRDIVADAGWTSAKKARSSTDPNTVVLIQSCRHGRQPAVPIPRGRPTGGTDADG